MPAGFRALTGTTVACLALARLRLTAKSRALVRRAGKRGFKVTLSGSGVKTGTVVLKEV